MKKTKVAHIITRMIIGGAQENTLYTVLGLDSDGRYDVTLITGPTYGPEGNLLEDYPQLYLDIETIPFLRRNLNPVFDFLALVHLCLVVKRGKYDIVHTHSAKAGILGRVAAKLCGVKQIVHTIHGLPFHRYENFLRRHLYVFLEKIVSRFTNKIITVCDDMIRQCEEVKIAESKNFQTIYSGLDINTFREDRSEKVAALKKKLNIPDDAFVIGKIGRLFHLKGHKYLLEAAGIIVRKVPQAVFLLVGGGILERELRQQAVRLGIEKNILFTGLISTSDIPVFLKLMDMVVHVSLREGLPRVIPQAYLSRRPVVAFDIDGARDIIQDGVNGFLVEPENVPLLVNRILQLINGPILRENFCREGEKFALEHFSKEQMVFKIMELYEQISSKNGALKN